MNNLEQLIGESIWRTYSDMAYTIIEKSITAMRRAGEFDDEGNPTTPRARYKTRQSFRRARKVADDLGEFGPAVRKAQVDLRFKPKKYARLRVPQQFADDPEETHKIAAMVRSRQKL